ncbi:Rab1a [Hexamita inflata]|uniref:Rab1a n=1 Tax=Hexamita inflata TaxID=28002 RepID=A0AA86TJI0_9EUKA|nr:Rab1a [Hexamita inflata]
MLLKQMPQGGVSDYVFKMMITGSSGVGKSTLIQAMNQSDFTNQNSQIKQQNIITVVKLGGRNYKVKLNSWDMPGAMVSLPITQTYFKTAQIILLVFDSTSMPSLNQVISQYVKIKAITKDAFLYLVGTKNDIESTKKIQILQEAQTQAMAINAKLFTLSGADPVQVNNMFQEVTKDALREKLGWSEEYDNISRSSWAKSRYSFKSFSFKIMESGVLGNSVQELDVVHETLLHEELPVNEQVEQVAVVAIKEKKGCCK